MSKQDLEDLLFTLYEFHKKYYWTSNKCKCIEFITFIT